MVLDTHVWLWWLSEPEQLSAKAQEAIEHAITRQKRLSISVISTWELALLVRKGRLHISMTVPDWVERSEALDLVTFVPVTNSIAVRSVELEMHPDPADRIIVATSLELGEALITKDDKLQARSLPTIW